MKKIVILFKFIFLYLSYWLVGLTEDDFYVTKGHYFSDLGKYHSAIFAYKKALKESESPSIYASIGWCYMNVYEDEKALECYRKAYEKTKRFEVALTLAGLEMECGNLEECEKVFSGIKETRDELPEDFLEMYDQVEKSIRGDDAERKS